MAHVFICFLEQLVSFGCEGQKQKGGNNQQIVIPLCVMDIEHQPTKRTTQATSSFS